MTVFFVLGPMIVGATLTIIGIKAGRQGVDFEELKAFLNLRGTTLEQSLSLFATVEGILYDNPALERKLREYLLSEGNERQS